MVILTIDLGTTATKADLWDETGPLASGRAELDTTHPAPDQAEQDADTWWPALVAACAQARSVAPEAWAAVAGMGFAAARQTLAPVDAEGSILGPALVWSDRRAGVQAQSLGRALGGAEAVRQRTGQYLRATSVPAKLAWLAEHRPELLDAARWILSPRDWMIWRLTGEVTTDPTLAGATGLYDRSGVVIGELAGPWVDHLAGVRPSSSVAGGLTREAAASLGLSAGIPVVIGAGDRACEVLGSGAGAGRPMVSWGTAANVSRPGWRSDRDVPAGLVATRSLPTVGEQLEGGRPGSSVQGEQLEGGLSAAGSMLAWLSRLTGQRVHDLAEAAATRPPGAAGLVVLPWLEGARAPWWDDTASAAVSGLRADTGPADLARAVLEGVAREVARVLTAMAVDDRGVDDRDKDDRELDAGPIDPAPDRELVLTGRGASGAAWVEIVAGVTGRAVQLRRSGQAAAVGAALVTADALGQAWTLDQLDPVVHRHQPDPGLVTRYRSLAPDADRLASALIAVQG